MAPAFDELLKENAKLKKKIEELKGIIDANHLADATTDQKDRLFRFMFGNPSNREWTLELYNALNGSHYEDASAIDFNTIGDMLYVGMKNDVSFIISAQMVMWEHQSTYNPNMPFRFFVYAGQLYDRYAISSGFKKYSESLQTIPAPICVCFYNGTAEKPDRSMLKLSDAYKGYGSIEVEVEMLNINYGRNRELMEACRPLGEYAWFVDAVRRHQENRQTLDQAVDEAINEMPDDFVIKRFIVGNKAEVKGMFLTEYDEEEAHKQWMEDGANRRNREIASKMLQKGEPIWKVVAYLGLTENEVLKIAAELGLEPVLA